MQNNPDITPSQKQAALTAALQSQTFSRSEQLKNFLRYVCEMEFAGRGEELSEYLIGVEALGRPADYSPGIDSAVRNRALVLRKKLIEYYENEASDAPIQIEFSKGSFCPRFISVTKPTTAAPAAKLGTNTTLGVKDTRGTHTHNEAPIVAGPTLPPGTVVPEAPSRQPENIKLWRQWPVIAGLILIAGLVATNIFQFKERSQPSSLGKPDPILAEAWGNVLTATEKVTLGLANPPHYAIHYETNLAPELKQKENPKLLKMPTPPELEAQYREWFPGLPWQGLYLTLTPNATYWGDVVGAMNTLKLLSGFGVKTEPLPERELSIAALRGQNVVLFGAPEYSTTVRYFLDQCPLTVIYLNSIVSRSPDQKLHPLYVSNTQPDKLNESVTTLTAKVSGLITVLPMKGSDENGGNAKVIIFSGTYSAGTQAAAEFFATPKHLQSLKEAFQKEGQAPFPLAYQAVISATVKDLILADLKLETIRIVPNSQN